MSKLDPSVTAYLDDSAEFAQPILSKWRKLVHKTCPNVEESIKWGIPHFNYKGDFMCVMASYKNHCSFTFIKAELMSDSRLKESKSLKPTQRFMGKVTSLKDLPSDAEFSKLLKEAMGLNDKGIKAVAKKSVTVKDLAVPDYMAKRLAKNPEAKAIFDSKSNSFRKEYIVWVSSAKTDETRQKRLDEALGWIAEGKSRFWKFKK